MMYLFDFTGWVLSSMLSQQWFYYLSACFIVYAITTLIAKIVYGG